MQTYRLPAVAFAAALVGLFALAGPAKAQTTDYPESAPPGYGAPPPPPGYVYAVPDEMRPRLIFKGLFGFGGNLRIDGEQPALAEPDMGTSLGVAAQAEAPLSRYFSFGGLVGALWFDPESIGANTIDRSVLVDINLIAKLRYPFGLGENHGEIYLGVPGGLTLSFLDTSLENTLGNDVRVGLGFNVGAVVGTQLFLTRSFGIMGEAGYQYHWFRHSVDRPLGGTFDTDLHFGQFVVNAGIVFAL